MGQSIFSNVIIAGASRVLVVLLGLCATALTVRVISVESFGAYSLVMTVGTFLQLFADFGLYLTASREIGATQGGDNNMVRHIVSLRLVLLGVVFAVGFLAFLFVPATKDLALLFIVLSLGLIFQSISQLMMGVFQAYGVIWKATLGDIVGRITQVILLWYFFYSQSGSVLGVALGFTLGLIVAFCIHIILVPRRSILLPQISTQAWKYLCKVSWPIAAMLILNVVYFRSDILILSFFRNATEVGVYALAYKVIENGLFFPAMLGGLLLPHISSAVSSKTKERAQALVSQGLTLSLYMAIIVVSMLIVFARPIVLLIAGSEFESSVILLQILALALSIMFIGNIFGFALIALSLQRKLAILYGVLVVFNIGMNVLFIPTYGAFAAAWTTVATEATAMVTAAYFVYRNIAWKLPIFRLCMALGAAAVAVYVGSILPVPIHIGFRLTAVSLLYVGIGYSLGLWNKEALMILRTTSSI